MARLMALAWAWYFVPPMLEPEQEQQNDGWAGDELVTTGDNCGADGVDKGNDGKITEIITIIIIIIIICSL